MFSIVLAWACLTLARGMPSLVYTTSIMITKDRTSLTLVVFLARLLEFKWKHDSAIDSNR
jgi:hypothetical protein